MGYVLTALFESPTNFALYDDDLAGFGTKNPDPSIMWWYYEELFLIPHNSDPYWLPIGSVYDIGSCQTQVDGYPDSIFRPDDML